MLLVSAKDRLSQIPSISISQKNVPTSPLYTHTRSVSPQRMNSWSLARKASSEMNTTTGLSAPASLEMLNLHCRIPFGVSSWTSSNNSPEGDFTGLSGVAILLLSTPSSLRVLTKRGATTSNAKANTAPTTMSICFVAILSPPVRLVLLRYCRGPYLESHPDVNVPSLLSVDVSDQVTLIV